MTMQSESVLQARASPTRSSTLCFGARARSAHEAVDAAGGSVLVDAGALGAAAGWPHADPTIAMTTAIATTVAKGAEREANLVIAAAAA